MRTNPIMTNYSNNNRHLRKESRQEHRCSLQKSKYNTKHKGNSHFLEYSGLGISYSNLLIFGLLASQCLIVACSTQMKLENQSNNRKLPNKIVGRNSLTNSTCHDKFFNAPTQKNVTHLEGNNLSSNTGNNIESPILPSPFMKLNYRLDNKYTFIHLKNRNNNKTTHVNQCMMMTVITRDSEDIDYKEINEKISVLQSLEGYPAITLILIPVHEQNEILKALLDTDGIHEVALGDKVYEGKTSFPSFVASTRR